MGLTAPSWPKPAGLVAGACTSKDGKPMYTYNFLGLQEYTVAGTEALPAGKATIRFEFVYDGGGVGKGGLGTIFVNGQKVASGRIETNRMLSVLSGRRRRRWCRRGHGGQCRLCGAVQIQRQDQKGDNRICKPTTPATASEADKARRKAALKVGLSQLTHSSRPQGRISTGGRQRGL